MAYKPSPHTGRGNAFSVFGQFRLVKHAQVSLPLQRALEEAHREMAGRVKQYGIEELRRTLKADRAYSRRQRSTTGIRAALRSDEIVQPRPGGWHTGFDYAPASVFQRYGAEGYWRVQERGDRGPRRQMIGFLLGPDGKLTNSPFNVPGVIGHPLTGSHRQRHVQRIRRGQILDTARARAAGKPVANWQNFPGAGMGSGGGSGRGFFISFQDLGATQMPFRFRPKPIQGKHFLAATIARFRRLDRRVIYQKHIDQQPALVGIRVRGSGRGGRAAGRVRASRQIR